MPEEQQTQTPDTDLKRAYKALSAKKLAHETLWSYYDGKMRLRWSTERLKDVFGTNASFIQNWGAVVVDTTLDRITMQGFEDGTLGDLFTETELDLDAYDVHKAALVCGESFVFVWKSEGGDIEAYYNDPRLCHVFYDAENPREKSMGAKWWVDGEDHLRLNLYYPDRIEYYRSSSTQQGVSSADNFQPYDGEGAPTAKNPFGEIPIFHFRRDRRVVRSELAPVLDSQDAINKLFSDKMVAAEFGAFRQRYFVTNADLKKALQNPYEHLTIPASEGEGESTQVGEFTPADLAGYIQAMQWLAAVIGYLTQTPQHYLFGGAAQISGEALIALEAPLNKKCSRYISNFTATWKRVGAFMQKLQSGFEVQASDVTPQFARPETVQPRTQAEIRQINVSAGIPLLTVLRKEGWTDQELGELESDLAAQRAQAEQDRAQATLQALRDLQAQQAEAAGATAGANGNTAPEAAA